MFRPWLNELKRRFATLQTLGRRPARRIVPSLPLIETLEVRLLPSTTYTVLNTNDSGSGSLRQAILSVNGDSTSDTIDFNITGSGAQTISLLSALPTITNSVTIDGTSQSGYAGTPLIVLSGASAGSSAVGLTITAGNSRVAGLVINGFGADGIDLTTNGGNVLTGNYIGTDATGSTAVANGVYGVLITSSNNTIGGTARNVISANGSTTTGADIAVSGSADNTLIEGNYIGTNAAGTATLGQAFAGIVLGGSVTNTTIGGTSAGARNVISGDVDRNIFLSGNSGSGTVIEGNYIGTTADGTASIGFSANYGIRADDAASTLFGGLTSTPGTGAGNVISGNGIGISVIGYGATGVMIIEGNIIGANAAGTAAVANGDGIAVGEITTGQQIGGTAAGARNLISGNTNFGVVFDLTTANDVVQGNWIGTDISGTAALDNGVGIGINGGASDVTIGGTTAGAGNVIAGNSGVGVDVAGTGTTGNLIEGNSIGLDKNGAALGNGNDGVFIGTGATGNTVGGTSASGGNKISSNAKYGIQVDGSTTTGNVVANNAVGTIQLNTSGALELSNSAAAQVAGSFTGNVLNQGSLSAVSSPTTFTITGNYTQSAGGILNMQLLSGGSFDKIPVSGTASLAGTLNVSLSGNFVPDPTQSFPILSASTVSGTFGTVNSPTYAGRALLSTQYNSGSVVLHGTTIIVNSTGDSASKGSGSPDTNNTISGQPKSLCAAPSRLPTLSAVPLTLTSTSPPVMAATTAAAAATGPSRRLLPCRSFQLR